MPLIKKKQSKLFKINNSDKIVQKSSDAFPFEDQEKELFEIDMEKEQHLLTENEQRFIEAYQSDRRKNRWILVLSLVVLFVVVLISFMLGRYSVTPVTVIKILVGQFVPIDQTWEDIYETVVLKVRVPRILAALAVGGSLAVAGASYQGLFRNPMVSPDLLGASAGASVGACGMMLFNQTGAAVTASAFVMGIAAVALSYFLSKAVGKGGNMVLLLVLCGMTVKTLFTAIVSIIKYLADTEEQLPAITYWLMGSIAKVSYTDLAFFVIPFLIGVIPLMALRWKLNILSFGEDEARALGIDVKKIRLICIICATLLTASVVSIAGEIGWVGLMIPHLVHFMVGPNNKKLLPMSLIVGAVFMLIVDNFCRTLLAYEIPLGVLTSLIGAPFFIFILYKGRSRA